MRNFSTSILLLFMLVILVCGIYPLALWCIGQTLFPLQANGSMIKGPDGKFVGSKLIAQEFTKDEYFQPRPSAANYDASASTSSALAASNYALRDRVARTLGSMVKYANGQPVAPDIEKWFQQDIFNGMHGIVAQWAAVHSELAQAWVNADPTHATYVDTWSSSHPDEVAKFIKDNPTIAKPKAVDLAVVFFQSFSAQNPGKFPSAVNNVITPVNTGADIQTIFFDMWRQDHSSAKLQNVPGDLVTTSASGLDPHISMQNALLQLDRVAVAIAAKIKRDPSAVAKEVQQILNTHAQAPFGGLAGEKFVNVLEVNLALSQQYH